VSSAERKGKAGPLEAGRGKHSPPANPERVTSEALKRRDNGVLLGKLESPILSIGYKNTGSKIQETPVKLPKIIPRNLDRMVSYPSCL
jgi:hypothetical protein